MRYSVWNSSTRAYDYYDTPGNSRSVHAGAPPRSASSSLGATTDEAAWPLPADATKTGSGEQPEGRIASRTAGKFTLDVPSMIIYGVLGYAIWRALK